MTKQFVIINKRKYATGLFWQPVAVGVSPYLYARQLVKNVNKKFNLFTEYKSMIGLALPKNSVHFGTSALAPEIIEYFSEYVSFLGVFRADLKYYLLAVRNGIIIKDVLIENEEEARKLYVELSDVPEWSALFAPASWGMPKSQEVILSDFVRPIVNAKLRQISIFRTLIPSMLLLGGFFLLIIYLVKNPIAELFIPQQKVEINPELAEEYKRQIEEKNKELDERFNIAKVEPIVYPFDSLPDKYERAKLCYKAMGFVMQPIAGWLQTHVTCKDEYVTANFKRDYGSLNDFYTVGNNIMPGVMVQEISENEVVVRVKLPKQETYSSIDERDADTVKRDITTVFQKANYNPEINIVVDTLTNGVDTENINVVEVGVASKLIPFEFMQAFRDTDGVYMTSVSWNINTRVWNYEVIIYTK